MFFARPSRLKIVFFAFAAVVLLLIVGLRLERPNRENAIKYGALEIKNNITEQCGTVIANEVKLVGSVAGGGKSPFSVAFDAYIGDTHIGDFGMFVFESVKFYGVVFPMIDVTGVTIFNCKDIEGLI